MGSTNALPTSAPFFQGANAQPLTAPWIGFFSDLLTMISNVGSAITAMSAIENVDTVVSAAVTFQADVGLMPAVTQGSIFTGRFVQDATGHVATFGTGFKGTPAVDPTPLMVSCFLWIGGADGNWWCVGYALGMHP